MKITRGKKIVAVIMALLMVVGIMPMDWVPESAKAADVKTYTFDATVLPAAAADKEALTGKVADDYVSVFGKVTKRTNTDMSIKAVELEKAEAGGFEFTVTGTASVKVAISSTGGSNSSVFSLKKDGVAVVPKGGTDGVVVVAGTSATAVEYENLEAGTYQMVSPESAEYNRNTRLMSIEITEVPKTVVKTYAFDATVLPAAAADKEELTGKVADDYVSVFGTVQKRTNTDMSIKAVELAKAEGGGFEFTVTGTASVKVAISSTGGSNSSVFSLKKDGVAVVPKGGTDGLVVVAGTSATAVEYENLEAGTYQMVSPESAEYNRNTRLMSFEITETSGGTRPPRADWTTVTAPEIGDITAADGTITVPYTMNIGYDGADSVAVIMKDAAGTELDREESTKTSTSGVFEFKPSATGTYTFSIVAKREACDDKAGTDKSVEFVLPLSAPSVSSATGDGKDSISLVWTKVPEADKYVVSYKVAGTDAYTKAGETAETKMAVSGLKPGTKYTFKIEAVRNTPAAITEVTYDKTFTDTVERVWSKAAVGTQAGDNNSKGKIEVKEDGSVTMYAPAGKMASSNDGFLFYYTEVVSDKENFRFSAKLTLDKFDGDNQSGVGLLVADTIGEEGKYDQCSALNYLLAGLSKTEWIDEAGTKITYPCGPGFRKVTGCTDPKGIDTTGRTLNQANPFIETLDTDSKTGSVVTKDTFAAGTCQKEYELTLVKDNNGYHATLANAEGVELHSWDPAKMLAQDSEKVYVGFAVSRKVTATFSDVKFESRNPADDPAKDESLWEKDLTPKNLFVYAGPTTSQSDYNYRYYGSWDANVKLTDGDGNELFSKDVAAYETISYDLKLTKDETKLITTITPDPEKVVAESYEPVVIEKTVKMKKYGKEGETIIVTPDGTSKGDGTEAKPLDIYTAVSYAQPGQVILLKDGKYDMYKDLIIPYSVSGTAGKRIVLMAENPGKVTLDGSTAENLAGSMIQVNGDYWHIFGLEICNSAKNKKGIQVSGNNNIVELCDIHDNGTTGLQISRSGGEPNEWWPKNNLIKNCDAYNNCDSAFNDADGFGAKLTVGEGNKFYGCIAHHNIDDGWDLYAKNEFGQGAIQPVVIENCVAYSNGTVPGVEQTGEGNGFKLGGEGLPGAHKLINSVSFDNGGKGITSNNGPDCQVINCTAFNNGQFYNTGVNEKSAQNISLAPLNGSKYNGTTNYVLNNTISLTTNKKAVKDQFTLIGQDALESETNYLLVDGASGLVSANSKGEQASVDWFKSTDTSVVPTRNANGSINMHDLLVLTDKAPKGVGAVIVTDGEAASVQPGVTNIVAAPKTGDSTNMVLYVIIALLSVAAVTGVVIYERRKRA